MDNNITKKTRKVGSKKQDSVLEVGIDAGFGNVKIYTKNNGEEIKITFPSRFKQIDHESTDVSDPPRQNSGKSGKTICWHHG